MTTHPNEAKGGTPRPTEPHNAGENPEAWAEIAQWESDRADALQERCAELERELKASAQSLETLTTTTSDPALKVWVGNIAASHRALLATKEPDKGKE